MGKDDEDDLKQDAAPDLQFLGDQVTFQPSGVERPTKPADDKDGALMKQMARFRSEPLQFLREVSLYVSGTGWRAYDDVIGQPMFYSGFSEEMKAAVLATPLLQERIRQMADARLAVLERERGDRPLRDDEKDAAYHMRRAQKKAELEEQLRQVAAVWTDRMICKFESKWFIRGAYYLTTQLLTRAYHQGIHVSAEDVLRLRKIAETATKANQSIVFLPCHRSHVDYVSLQLICYRLGIALPVVVAGDNLNMPVVGSFLQHAGAMWIRRTFGDDALYTTLVQSYIDTMLQKGFNVECFIEGGRSRTGKLLSPKFGILSFILDSILSGRVKDAIIIPVSTQYDKVIETEGYVTELLGVPKKKENLLDFLTDGSSVLSLRLGRVDVRFHEGWSLRDFINTQLTKLGTEPSSPGEDSKARIGASTRQKILQTMGYKVLTNINDVSVVMPTALVGTVLLTLRGRGVGKSELMRRVEWLSSRVRAKGGRVAHFQNASLSDIVDRALDVLGKDLVREVEGLAETTYFAQDRFQLSFYRNMTIHLFIYEALVSVAMYKTVKIGGGSGTEDITYDDLKMQVLFLSTLFRGEFIYAGEGLDHNLDKTIRGLEADGILRLDWNDKGQIATVGLSANERLSGRENYDFYCFMLWPFVEASWLAAVSLMGLTPPLEWGDEEAWIESSKVLNSAQLLGKTLYHQGDLSYYEAVNKETLKNAIQRFQEEGIIQTLKDSDKAKTSVRMRLAPEWTPTRDLATGQLLATGRLWDFTDRISASRREGKNRRDGATVRTRVVQLTDRMGAQLFDEVRRAAETDGASPFRPTGQDKGAGRRGPKKDRRKGRLDQVAKL